MNEKPAFLPDCIYLDHNATTPVAPSVASLMDGVLREDFGNASSGHPYGRRARQRIEEARSRVASLLGCDPEEVIFTGGGSESNNLAIRGVAEALGDRLSGVVITAVEHPAVIEPARWLERRGMRLEVIGVDGDGTVAPDDVEAAVRKLGGPGKPVLVSVMHANNEVGTLQPVAEIVRRVRPLGAILHTDAAQSVGKIPVDAGSLGVDLLTVAGHKFYGPKGVGALFIRRETAVAPFVLGAGHEGGLRSGTENVAGIAGLGEAARLAKESVETDGARIAGLRDALWEGLREKIPGVCRNGHPRDVLPNTLNLSFPGVAGRDVLERCPGVAASTGAACHDQDARPSGVLGAMGLSSERAAGAVRLSLGKWTGRDDVKDAADRLIVAWRSAREG
jgi:cysteine desulfurase